MKAARCGNCKTDFGSIQKAADHVATHQPRRKPASPGKPLWSVGYDRAGKIIEVVSGPVVE